MMNCDEEYPKLVLKRDFCKCITFNVMHLQKFRLEESLLSPVDGNDSQ